MDAQEIRGMPDEKLEELYSKVVVRKLDCDECGVTTWFMAPSGHNSRSSCHNCGHGIPVVG